MPHRVYRQSVTGDGFLQPLERRAMLNMSAADVRYEEAFIPISPPNDIEFSGERKRVRCNEVLGSPGLWSPLPGETKVLLARGALPKIKIDEGLVWDSRLLRERPEVRDRGFVQAKSDLALEPPCIGIGPALREVIVLSHDLNLPK